MRFLCAFLAFVLVFASTSPLRADLKGYWSFNDGAGTTLTDGSGLGHNGTLTGAQSWQPGVTSRPGDYSFDTSASYFGLGNPSDFQITGSQTISMWLQPSATVQANVGAGRQNPWNKAYANEGTMTVEAGGQINFFNGNGSGYNSIYSTAAVAPGPNWTHITLVRDSSGSGTLTWYFNGAFAGTLNNSAYTPNTASSAAPVQLGFGYTGVYFQGRLDDTSLWNEALSAGEVAALFKADTQTAAPMYTGNYNVADLDKLFQVWEDAGSSTALVHGKEWKYISGFNTSGHSVGDSWSFGSANSAGVFLFLNGPSAERHSSTAASIFP